MIGQQVNYKWATSGKLFNKFLKRFYFISFLIFQSLEFQILL